MYIYYKYIRMTEYITSRLYFQVLSRLSDLNLQSNGFFSHTFFSTPTVHHEQCSQLLL